MVLDIIKKEIENYKKFITSSKYDELYKWEALKNFHENWNIEASDFLGMYEKSFHSGYTQNLWANPHWFPKAVMIEFIQFDKERVRQMFRDLYDEGLSVAVRIERFVFHCERLREEVSKINNRMKSHFHDGLRIVSLYLAFRFPNKYAIYKFSEFKAFMEGVRAKDIPGTGDHERFFKVVRTINSILIQDEELIMTHSNLLNKNCYIGDTLMLAQDFIFFTGRRYRGLVSI